MKRVFFLMLLTSVFLFNSCDSKLSKARERYKAHLEWMLKDPESLKIYKETYHKEDNATYIFRVDYGARNGYGGMVRSQRVFTVIGNSVWDMDADEYDEMKRKRQ